MHLAVGLLGPLEFHRDGERIAGPAGRQRTVLALLVLEPTQLITRKRLMTELWRDGPPPSAAANLRTYLSGLRAWCNRTRSPRPGLPDPLARRDGGWRLDLGGQVQVDVDALRFDVDLVLGRRAARNGDLPAAARHLVQALHAYRGWPLQDVPQGMMLAARAEMLHARWSAAVEDYAEVLLRLGEFERARVLLRGFLAEHPYRERAWAQLMLTCHGTGDTVGALDAYRRARTVLIRDYGIEPGPRLAGLHRAILRREPRLYGTEWYPGWPTTAVRRTRTRRPTVIPDSGA